MTLTLASAASLLSQHNLLREVVHGDVWQLDASGIDGADTPFEKLTYDTREIAPGTLLVCKGRFKPEFLDGTEVKGLAAYVAETDLSEHTNRPGLIVNDARKALSLLAAEFYDHPERELTLVGITGTKGKTTTAYSRRPSSMHTAAGAAPCSPPWTTVSTATPTPNRISPRPNRSTRCA